jgi:translation elongation factor EF-1beta
MLEKAKNILCNEKGMETIEVIGMGVVALIAVALFFNATKGNFDSINNKIENGLKDINNLDINGGTTGDTFDIEPGSNTNN